MAIQHKDIPDSQLHVPKGAGTAALHETIHGDGSGGVTWEKVSPPNLSGITTNGSAGQYVVSNGDGTFAIETTDHGSVTFINTATPTAVVTPTVFTKIAPTTTPSGHPSSVTETTTARLTYTGAHQEHVGISSSISFDHTAGANRDISFAIALNGTVVAETEQLSTCTTTTKQSLSLYCDLHINQNDYVEVFTKISGTGNVQIYCFNLIMEKV